MLLTKFKLYENFEKSISVKEYGFFNRFYLVWSILSIIGGFIFIFITFNPYFNSNSSFYVNINFLFSLIIGISLYLLVVCILRYSSIWSSLQFIPERGIFLSVSLSVIFSGGYYGLRLENIYENSPFATNEFFNVVIGTGVGLFLIFEFFSLSFTALFKRKLIVFFRQENEVFSSS